MNDNFNLRMMFSDDRPLLMPRVKSEEAPIEVLTRWTTTRSGALYKRFIFADNETRNEFVRVVLESELETQHPCQMKIADKCVNISIATEGHGFPTDIDEETAKQIDFLYSDVCSMMLHLKNGVGQWTE